VAEGRSGAARSPVREPGMRGGRRREKLSSRRLSAPCSVGEAGEASFHPRKETCLRQPQNELL